MRQRLRRRPRAPRPPCEVIRRREEAQAVGPAAHPEDVLDVRFEALDRATALVIVVVVGFYALRTMRARAQQQIAKRRAENKVRMSDPILRSDIKILEKTNSVFLSDAIALRRAQVVREPDQSWTYRRRGRR